MSEQDSATAFEFTYLCMTAYGWGQGANADAALKACRDYNGRSHVQKYGYVIYRVPKPFEVCQIDGTIYTPKDAPKPEKVLDRIVKKKTKPAA